MGEGRCEGGMVAAFTDVAHTECEVVGESAKESSVTISLGVCPCSKDSGIKCYHGING